jgi:putative hydrolase of the HAD superfamily
MYHSGLEKYFQTVTNSEMAGVKKPHRNIFEFALSLAKTKKENSIMIGDCIDADFNGAIEFGMRAILFDEKNLHKETTFERVSHLLEIKKIL